MAINNQASGNVDEAIDWAAMADILNLGHILKLIHQAFNGSLFGEKYVV